MTEYIPLKSAFNPFNPSGTVPPSLFAGRVVQVRSICEKLSQIKYGSSASFLIHGERGIGKTALAKLISYVAEAKDPNIHNLNLVTLYYSVEEDQPISSVLQASINIITDKLDKTLLDDIGNRVGKLFKNGKFEIGAFGVNAAYESKDEKAEEVTVKDQTVSILSNLIRNICKEGSYDGILIIIDEINKIRNLPSFASILRNILTSLDFEGIGKISFLLIGYPEDVDKFFSTDPSARRAFSTIPLEVMPLKEAKEIITKGFNKIELKYDEKIIENYIDVAGGYPHSVQMLGHNLVKTDKDNYVDIHDFTAAMLDTANELIDKDFASMFSFRKSQLTDKDKILVFLANQEAQILKKDLLEAKITKNMYRDLKELKKKGAVKEYEGKIILSSQLLRTAILFDRAVSNITEKNRTKAGKATHDEPKHSIEQSQETNESKS